VKFSIITVTFNSAATIEDTIRSVAAQDYPGKEHIIVDGGSTDGTINIVNRFRVHVSKFISEKDDGLYHALNKGIALAEGDVVAILHSDDFFIGNHVLDDYAKLFEDPRCDAAYSDLYYVRREDPAKVIRKWKSGVYRPGSFKFGWMPPHPTFFVRRELYDRYGHFNTSLKSAADYELMLRFIHVNKIRLCYLPLFTVKMRVGGKSNQSLLNRLIANKEDRRAWELNGLPVKFYTFLLKPLRKVFQFIT
jgi:glycosyltransferase involved in cell wall biosynthesis